MGAFSDFLLFKTKKKAWAASFAEILKKEIYAHPKGNIPEQEEELSVTSEKREHRVKIVVDDLFGRAGCAADKVELIERLIITFAEQNVGAQFSLNYDVDCYLCGDSARVFCTCDGSNISEKKTFFERGISTFCRECESEVLDYLDDIEDGNFDENTEYKCPKCGAKLHTDFCIERVEEAIEDFLLSKTQ